ncbi:SpoIIE family protein phosphatase [Streptomyces sp. NPDC047028]|uniref:SpoIIE family protein phosphatase n=1 Tax=Streptomyces sp. NPDC047028 TaxID=3155793 RepID=UPI003402D0B1
MSGRHTAERAVLTHEWSNRPGPAGGARGQRHIATYLQRSRLPDALSDGLMERRGEDLSAGLERLSRAAVRLRGRTPETLLDELVEQVAPAPAPGDDIAVLALCHAPE